MKKENYDKLSEEEKDMMQIGARALTRIINEMNKCEAKEDGSLIYRCEDAENPDIVRYFILTGYEKNGDSPQKPNV